MSDDVEVVRHALRVLESVNDVKSYVDSSTRASLRDDPIAICSCDRLLNEIDALENAHKTLRRAIDTKVTMLSSLVNRCASIAALPNEILCLIFIEGYHSSVAPLRGRDQDPTKYLRAISQTCKRFRDVSISCTLLWTRVHIEWSPKQRQLWVQRSGNRELDIHAHRPRPPRPEGFADAPGDVFERFDKWRTLCFTETSTTMITTVLRAIPPTVRCPSLQSIVIKSVSGLGNSREAPKNIDERLWCKLAPTAEGSAFPKLRRITFWVAPYTPWGMLDNVTVLDVHLSQYSWEYWRQLLQQTNMLQTLSLGAEWHGRSDHEDEHRGSPVILSHLHSLELRKDDARFLKLFLSDVTAPSLDNLSIWVPTKGNLIGLLWEDITCALSGFLSRSPLISKLTLRGGYTGILEILLFLEDSLDTLSVLPAIQILEIGGEYLYSPNIREALYDFVQGLSKSCHRSPLQVLILPEPDEATQLLPYVGEIKPLGDNQDSSLAAFYDYDYSVAGDDDEGPTENEDEDDDDDDDDDDEMGYLDPYSYDDDYYLPGAGPGPCCCPECIFVSDEDEDYEF